MSGAILLISTFLLDGYGYIENKCFKLKLESLIQICGTKGLATSTEMWRVGKLENKESLQNYWNLSTLCNGIKTAN